MNASNGACGYSVSRKVLAGVAVAVMAKLVCLADPGPLDNWQERKHLGGTARVVYGNDRFVVYASAYTSYLLVSTNGSDWRSFLPPESGPVMTLEFANGNFLLLLSRWWQPNNGVVLYSSTDGISWVLRRFSQSESFSIPISSAGGGNGVYVMAASDLSVSTDLVNWRQSFRGMTSLRQFTSGLGRIIGTPWQGAGFAVTSGGETWEYIAPPGGCSYTSIAFANSRFAAFAPGDTSSAIGVSIDGLDWSHTFRQEFTNCTRLAGCNDRFILLSADRFHSSSDAMNWSEHSFGTNASIDDIAFGANCYVAVGNVILQSSPVTNPAPVAAELSMRNLPGLTIAGPAGQAYQIEATDNLANTNSWVSLTNIVALTSPFLWVDTSHTNQKPRFYRAFTCPSGD
jgi:hypothetical protein